MSSFGFRLICGIYLFFNISFFIYYSFGNPLLGDFKELHGSLSVEILALGFSFVLMSFIIIVLIVKPLLRLPVKYVIRLKSNVVLDSLFFIISLFYFICIVFFGVGVSGVDVSQLKVSKLILYLYAILQPNFLLMIYIFCYYHSRNLFYWLILLTFISSSIMSGATANFIFIFLLFSSYSINKFRVIILLLIGIVLSPFVRFGKYVLLAYNRASSSGDNINILQAVATYKTSEMSLFDTYLYFLKGSFSRFEMVSSSSFIIKYSNQIHDYAHSIGILYPQNLYFLYKFFYENLFLLSTYNNQSLQYIFALFISGKDDWNANIGFFGFASLGGLDSVFVYLLVFFLICFTVILSRILRGDGAILQLTLIYIIVVVWHGWISAFIYYSHALILFALIVLFFTRFKPYR